MPYVPLDENLPEHPKVLALPFDDMNAALGLVVRAWCYCSRNLSDGFVPDGFFRTVDDKRLRELLLTDNGFGLLFDAAENGILVHDYLDCNRSRAEMEAYREIKRVAGKKGGKRSGEVRKEAKPKQVLGVCLEGASSKTNLHVLELEHKEKETRPLRACPSIPDEVRGYYADKIGREPNASELNSLMVLCKRFNSYIVNTAIGQASMQGGGADNFALITTIAKKEAGLT